MVPLLFEILVMAFVPLSGLNSEGAVIAAAAVERELSAPFGLNMCGPSRVVGSIVAGYDG